MYPANFLTKNLKNRLPRCFHYAAVKEFREVVAGSPTAPPDDPPVSRDASASFSENPHPLISYLPCSISGPAINPQVARDTTGETRTEIHWAPFHLIPSWEGKCLRQCENLGVKLASCTRESDTN
ncbi:hypothetical protein MRX96_048067 [Rhipicephalus microplus]